MSVKLKFKLVIEDDGKEVYSKSLPYEIVANITLAYDDSTDNCDFFALAAKHPASAVRENVAYKSKMSKDTLNYLIKDTSIAVLRNLINTEVFKEHATEDVIEKLVKLDLEIARDIANDYDSYQQANATKLCATLLGLSDPAISYALAGNYNVPKKILKELAGHPDSFISAEAKRRLED